MPGCIDLLFGFLFSLIFLLECHLSSCYVHLHLSSKSTSRSRAPLDNYNYNNKASPSLSSSSSNSSVLLPGSWVAVSLAEGPSPGLNGFTVAVFDTVVGRSLKSRKQVPFWWDTLRYPNVSIAAWDTSGGHKLTIDTEGGLLYLVVNNDAPDGSPASSTALFTYRYYNQSLDDYQRPEYVQHCVFDWWKPLEEQRYPFHYIQWVQGTNSDGHAGGRLAGIFTNYSFNVDHSATIFYIDPQRCSAQVMIKGLPPQMGTSFLDYHSGSHQLLYPAYDNPNTQLVLVDFSSIDQPALKKVIRTPTPQAGFRGYQLDVLVDPLSSPDSPVFYLVNGYFNNICSTWKFNANTNEFFLLQKDRPYLGARVVYLSVNLSNSSSRPNRNGNRMNQLMIDSSTSSSAADLRLEPVIKPCFFTYGYHSEEECYDIANVNISYWPPSGSGPMTVIDTPFAHKPPMDLRPFKNHPSG